MTGSGLHRSRLDFRRRVGPAALVGAFLLAGTVGPPGARASETLEAPRPVGHPRSRFPLTVHVGPPPDPAFVATLRATVEAWNGLFQGELGVPAFTWREQEEGADVIVRFVPAAPTAPIGLTHLDADPLGVIVLPVRIELAAPTAMGGTPAETVLFQVLAHELGHAVGLAHTDDPGSIMCCARGAVNFGDPAVRARYVEARRRPDVGSMASQLRLLYRQLWAP